MQTTLLLLMAQLGLVLIVAMILGRLAERLRLPPIVGQLMAGVVLGPTLFGTVLPHQYAILFPPHNKQLTAERTDFVEVGLMLFILFVGFEINVGTLRERVRVIAPVSIGSIIVPFALGFASVLLLPQVYGHAPSGGKPLALPFIIGVALSISALPVIAAIISDLGLLRTEVGQIILSSAVVNDLYGWLGFAAVTAAFTSSGKGTTPLWVVVLIVLAGFALALTVSRKVGSGVTRWLERYARHVVLALGVIIAIVLLAS